MIAAPWVILAAVIAVWWQAAPPPVDVRELDLRFRYGELEGSYAPNTDLRSMYV